MICPETEYIIEQLIQGNEKKCGKKGKNEKNRPSLF